MKTKSQILSDYLIKENTIKAPYLYPKAKFWKVFGRDARSNTREFYWYIYKRERNVEFSTPDFIINTVKADFEEWLKEIGFFLYPFPNTVIRELQENGKDWREYLEYHTAWVLHALNNKLYVRDIAKGIVTPKEVNDIIKSAGLDNDQTLIKVNNTATVTKLEQKQISQIPEIAKEDNIVLKEPNIINYKASKTINVVFPNYSIARLFVERLRGQYEKYQDYGNVIGISYNSEREKKAIEEYVKKEMTYQKIQPIFAEKTITSDFKIPKTFNKKYKLRLKTHYVDVYGAPVVIFGYELAFVRVKEKNQYFYTFIFPKTGITLGLNSTNKADVFLKSINKLIELGEERVAQEYKVHHELNKNIEENKDIKEENTKPSIATKQALPIKHKLKNGEIWIEDFNETNCNVYFIKNGAIESILMPISQADTFLSLKQKQQYILGKRVFKIDNSDFDRLLKNEIYRSWEKPINQPKDYKAEKEPERKAKPTKKEAEKPIAPIFLKPYNKEVNYAQLYKPQTSAYQLFKNISERFGLSGSEINYLAYNGQNDIQKLALFTQKNADLYIKGNKRTIAPYDDSAIKETHEISRAFAERQKQLEKYIPADELQEEKNIDKANAILNRLENNGQITQKEADWLNETQFIAKGFKYTRYGLQKAAIKPAPKPQAQAPKQEPKPVVPKVKKVKTKQEPKPVVPKVKKVKPKQEPKPVVPKVKKVKPKQEPKPVVPKVKKVKPKQEPKPVVPKVKTQKPKAKVKPTKIKPVKTMKTATPKKTRKKANLKQLKALAKGQTIRKRAMEIMEKAGKRKVCKDVYNTTLAKAMRKASAELK